MIGSERELVITRVFNAPRELVFRAWAEADRAARWWGPRGFTLLSCEMDVRSGGAWRRVMRSPEGIVHVKRGFYREIAPPERLVFTYADEEGEGRLGPETLVTVSLAEDRGRTRLTLHQALFTTREACLSHEGGWTGALERLAGFIESQ